MSDAPLRGARVVVTRARHQAGELTEKLEAAGAEVSLLPLIELTEPADPRPLERAATELALYRWVVFTSANAVDAVLERCGGALPSSTRVAAVGARTEKALEGYERSADLLARDPRAEGLAAELEPLLSRRERVLLPQAGDARSILGDRLEAAGAEVVRIVAYDKRLPADAAEKAREVFGNAPLGWVTFTSPSVVRGLVQVLRDDWPARRDTLGAVSIGPVTSDELRRQGVARVVEAASPSSRGLVEALVATTRVSASSLRRTRRAGGPSGRTS